MFECEYNYNLDKINEAIKALINVNQKWTYRELAKTLGMANISTLHHFLKKHCIHNKIEINGYLKEWFERKEE